MKIYKILKSFVSSRLFPVVPAILLQIAVIFVGVSLLAEYYVVIDIIFNIISFLVVMYILDQKIKPAYKMGWVLIILVIPIVGGVLYLVLGGNGASGRFLKKVDASAKKYSDKFIKNELYYTELRSEDKSIAKQAEYIYNSVKYPIYKNTMVNYLAMGEDFFEDLIEQIRKAEHHIFIEIFILEPGIMWDTLLAILKEKVSEGVEVRLIYDDMGSLFTLPPAYYKTIREFGIKCHAFNKFDALMSLKHNNRDHRKIIIIDGHTCYTGGCNLADEYINGYAKYGSKWKDIMIRLDGEAVETFTIMFLQHWQSVEKRGFDEEKEFSKFKPHEHHKENFNSDGYIIPYGDSPLDTDNTGEMIYLNMIHAAKKYIYICTPYFVVDDELLTAILVAAKSGVNVKIITPHYADKSYVHAVTRSYYSTLLEAGAKVYEYEPGFIHSKSVVVDDDLAVVGTVNFDYRSLYLHFECGVWIYKSKCVMDIKKDFINTLNNETIEITLEDEKNVSGPIRFARRFLRNFAPLM